MKDILREIASVNLPNGLVITLINLASVKDIVTIALGLVSIVATALVIREKLLKKKD